MNDKLKKKHRGKSGYFFRKPADNQEIILRYLQSYYQSLDEYYLEEAMQLAKDGNIDFQRMISIARARLN